MAKQPAPETSAPAPAGGQTGTWKDPYRSYNFKVMVQGVGDGRLRGGLRPYQVARPDDAAAGVRGHGCGQPLARAQRTGGREQRTGIRGACVFRRHDD